MKKTPKHYPNDGPPRHIQEARLNPARSKDDTRRIRDWVKANPNARPETLKAYSV